MKQYLTSCHHFLHGADYNPEQWIKYPAILDEDIQFMKKAHCNVVSLGIFSWSLLEPEEGVYDFAFFDQVVEKLTDNGIQIILATPSGARPRWLAEKYPEVLRVGTDGQKQQYGLRHNHCFTSPVYREKVRNINRRIAERYQDQKNIILWHISNEYGGECHCELCQQAFRDWLREKYHKDLCKLNDAWWTGFWSHTVTDWQQVHSPAATGEPDDVLPGLFLDWKEFVTYQTTSFMQEEIAAVKEFTPQIPVTTNFMGPYQHLDYNYMRKYVDVISWDCYPTWHSERGDVIEAYSIAFAHDLHRGLKQKPFLLMESTPSNTNWFDICKLKRPGMHRLSSIQAVAHGSDSVQYFQWRKGRGGMEKFHGAVIDHNGKAEGRVFEDVKNLGILLERIDEIAGSRTNAQAAVVYDYRNRWAIEDAAGFQNADKKYKRTCINHYKEFWKRGINVDVIDLSHDLSQYKILVLPMLYSIAEKDIKKIEEYTANGGTVIATYITGYVNETDLCYLGGFPGGKLKDVFGLVADEIDSLNPGDRNTVRFHDSQYEAVDYCELITPVTAEPLAFYCSDFYRGKAAVLRNQYKQGTAYYIGCRDSGELLHAFYDDVIKNSSLRHYELPYGVTIHSRETEEYEYLFVENYTTQRVEIGMSEAVRDLENDERLPENATVAIDGYGVRVLARPLRKKA